MPQKPMLIVVSGPDRVGKSTLISRMVADYGDQVFVSHHGAPPKDQENIFDFYRKDVLDFIESDSKLAIFDRAWPCSYILEQHRRRNAGHLEDLIDFELWLNEQDTGVVHLGMFRPWNWSAPLHVEELREEYPDVAEWFIRDEYIARMAEHRVYTDQLLEFYENITMFPAVRLNADATGEQALALASTALRSTAT